LIISSAWGFCITLMTLMGDSIIYRLYVNLEDITIGLYNRYGRFLHRANRLWIKINAGEDMNVGCHLSKSRYTAGNSRIIMSRPMRLINMLIPMKVIIQ